MATVTVANLPWWISDADLETLCTELHPPVSNNIRSIGFAADVVSGKSLGRAAIALLDASLAKPLSEALQRSPPPSSSSSPVSIDVLASDDQNALNSFLNPVRQQSNFLPPPTAPFPNVPLPPHFPFQNGIFPPGLPIPPPNMPPSLPPNIPHPNLMPPLMWMPPPLANKKPPSDRPSDTKFAHDLETTDPKRASSNSASQNSRDPTRSSDRGPSPEAIPHSQATPISLHEGRGIDVPRQDRSDRDLHSHPASDAETTDNDRAPDHTERRDRGERLIITERGERALVLRPDTGSREHDSTSKGAVERRAYDDNLEPRERELHIPEEVKERLRERRETERHSRRKARERERERDRFMRRSHSHSPSFYNSRDPERNRVYEHGWDREREWDRNRERKRERDWERDRGRERDRGERDRDREKEWDRDRERDRERDRPRHRERDRERERYRVRDRDLEQISSPYGNHERSRSRSPEWSEERRTKRRRSVEYEDRYEQEGTWRGRAAPLGLDEELGKDSEEKRRGRRKSGRVRRRGYGGSSGVGTASGADALVSAGRTNVPRGTSKRANVSRR